MKNFGVKKRPHQDNNKENPPQERTFACLLYNKSLGSGNL